VLKAECACYDTLDIHVLDMHVDDVYVLDVQ